MGNRKVSLLSAVLALANPARSLGWRNGKTAAVSSPVIGQLTSSDVYAAALFELQELESEPLCHRIAARLLVSNCQLLDGQNDATVITDTGRAARDFVDSFAASLAICDLERANFEIPSSCSKFREPVLASLPAPAKPQLHVITAEIDKCLEGLARSDSAWSTWVSYRHKALRFCEAARADHDKDQHIILHKRLATILERLTNQAESAFRGRAEKFDSMLQDSNQRAEILKEYLDQFRTRFLQFDALLAESILSKSKETEVALVNSMKGAKSFEDFVQAAFRKAALWEEQTAQAHEKALDTAVVQANHGLNEIMAVVAGVSQVSMALQAQLDKSEGQVASIMRMQQDMQQASLPREAGFSRKLTSSKKLELLNVLADEATDKHRTNGALLQATQNKTHQILSSLNDAASSISALQAPLVRLGWAGWWPYIPSVTRNLILIGASEAAGFFLSYMREFGAHSIDATRSRLTFLSRAEQTGASAPVNLDNERSASLNNSGGM